MRLSRACWIHLKGGNVLEVVYSYVLACRSQKNLRLRILYASLCVLGPRYSRMEWAKAHFLHPEKCHLASEDHCIAITGP